MRVSCDSLWSDSHDLRNLDSSHEVIHEPNAGSTSAEGRSWSPSHSDDDETITKATAWLGDGEVALSGDAYIYGSSYLRVGS